MRIRWKPLDHEAVASLDLSSLSLLLKNFDCPFDIPVPSQANTRLVAKTPLLRWVTESRTRRKSRQTTAEFAHLSTVCKVPLDFLLPPQTLRFFRYN